MSMNPEMEGAVSTCGNCRSPMPAGLRFCRNCGFRLGEGSAEYTETVRFQNAPPGTLPRNNAPNSGPYGFAGGPLSIPQRGGIGKRRRRISGTSWMFIGLLIFFMAAAGLTAIVKQVRPRIRGGGVAAVVAPKSYAGVDDFQTVEGNIGVTFASAETPDGPADKAGLVGGDIITTVDGQPVHSDDEITEVMRRIPIGKTVDIVYLRDGETKNTKLTTISREEMERLNEVFGDRPEGRGLFGYEDDDAHRVEIPGTKLFGVQLGEILQSRPADIAGIKQGDIVIKFGDVPIRTPEEFLVRVRRAIPYSTVDLTVIRNGEQMKIPVKMGKG
ncbi:MAG TPA: PDZ domain-containing protein [Pyrinomonadaceae bacterium]|nr:PDZ domain-containing protein [Pyrinomonadaceae bacterium]